MNDELVSKVKKYVGTHQIAAKSALENTNDVQEILNSIRNNIIISEKLYVPKYRKGGFVGKLANYILEKEFRITRKIINGSLTTQDSINFAFLEAIEKIDKKISHDNKTK